MYVIPALIARRSGEGATGGGGDGATEGRGGGSQRTVLSPGGPCRRRPALRSDRRSLVIHRDDAVPCPAGKEVDAAGPDDEVLGVAAVGEPDALGDSPRLTVERLQDPARAAPAVCCR